MNRIKYVFLSVVSVLVSSSDDYTMVQRVPDASSLHAAPIFLKLHKVGSSSVSLHLECWSKALRWSFPGLSHIRCQHEIGTSRSVFQRKWNQMNGVFSGPWNHAAVDMYIRYGLAGFDYCMNLKHNLQQPQPKLLVMLRDPIERFFSYIQFFLELVPLNTKAYFGHVMNWTTYEEHGDKSIINASTDQVKEWFQELPPLNVPLFEYEYVFGGKRMGFDPTRMFSMRRARRNHSSTFGLEAIVDRAKYRISNEVIVGVAEHMDESLVLFMLALQQPMPTFCSPLGSAVRVKEGANETIVTQKTLNSRKSYRSKCDPQFLQDLERYELPTEMTIYQHALQVHTSQVEKMNEEFGGVHAKSLNMLHSDKHRTLCKELQQEISEETASKTLLYGLRDIDMAKTCTEHAESIRNKWHVP